MCTSLGQTIIPDSLRRINSFLNITGFKHFELYELTDQDGTVVFGDDTERETVGWQFTQEIRNSFEPSENVQVVAVRVAADEKEQVGEFPVG